MAQRPTTPKGPAQVRSSRANGGLAADPTGFDRTAPRPREVGRLSNITLQAKRLNPNPLAKRFTKFITNYTGQIQIPKNIVHPGRGKQDNRFHIDVGQIPED